jgi:lipopolysaccharide transport system ATP-binding protein
VTEVSLTDKSGVLASTIASTESFAINVTVDASRLTPPMQIPVRITNQEGIPVLTTSNVDHAAKLVALTPGRHRYRVIVPGNLLAPGSYNVGVWAHIPRTILFDHVDSLAFRLEDTGSVASALKDDRWGVVTPLLQWEHMSASETDDHVINLPAEAAAVSGSESRRS